MNTLWILIANRGFAKIIEVKGHGKHFKEIHHFENPDAFKKDTDVLSDRPGRGFSSMGVARHAYSQPVDFTEQEQRVFARKLAAFLHEGKEHKAFDELALVAPPHFLGELNNAISDAVRKSIIKEIHKDLPKHLTNQERIDQLCKYLDLWNHAT